MFWNSKWFPGTNLQDINLDWILKKISALRGGSAGQYLYKKSDKDFDFGWEAGSAAVDYLDLDNKPSINNIELVGNKTASDLGLASSSDIPTVPVQSVNGKTGEVILNAADVGAGTYSKPDDGIPKTDLASSVQTSLEKADTALQSVPFTYRTAAAQDVIDTAIEENFAQFETSPTASQHIVGEYLFYNGKLYTVTTSVLEGRPLIPGGNIQEIHATDVAPKLIHLSGGSSATLHHSTPVLIFSDRGGLWSTGQSSSRGLATLVEYTGITITLVDNTTLTISSNIAAGVAISVISGGYSYFS